MQQRRGKPESHYLTKHARHVLTIDTVRGQKTLHMRDADLTPLRIDDSSNLNHTSTSTPPRPFTTLVTCSNRISPRQ